jgi:hypothetical protein
VGVAGYPTYKRKGVVEQLASLTSFTTTMNARKFNFTYDHAVAIME